jgi:hypothetical protein
MCTTLSHEVVVGTGGNVVVDVVVVVEVDDVLVVDVVVVVLAADVDDVGAIDDGVVDEDRSTLVVTPPTSADWICSLHAGRSGIARITHQARRRFTLPLRPKRQLPGARLRRARAPSSRRDDR